MKKILLLILSIVVSTRLQAQQPGAIPPSPVPGNSFSDRVKQIQNANQQADSALTRFNLDFSGGTPRQLATAIESAMGKPLNVIVPEEFADTKLPPIKVTGVTVAQLFQSLLDGSYKRSPTRGDIIGSYGFKAGDVPPTDATIWTFYVTKTQEQPSGLTQFSIDFPGGTPKQLAAAIQKATGHPLNVIVPEDAADTKLPPLKMNDVHVNDLFHALELASYKTEPYVTGGGFQTYQLTTTGYGFKTDGRVTDDSIWYFHVDRVPKPPGNSPNKISRFYALAPYLDAGLKVDDITTAVETAWKMTGETAPPAISFHKDTKLLIAVGEPEKLQTIDSILQALKPATAPKPQTLQALPAKKSSETKTDE